jgi:cysteine desulfurase
MRPQVVEAMMPWLGRLTGNSTGAHRLAREARTAVEEARETVADVLGCAPGEVVFTSGGTESDNLALHGRASLACSAIEHHAVLEPVLAAGGQVFPVDGVGRVRTDAVPPAELVSVMLANNEVGTIQDLGAVRAACPDALLHTDAVQAAAWLDLAVEARSADLVSVTGHKLGGPQGCGALVVRTGASLSPTTLGGGQERGLRSGTHNVAGIVGLAAALRAAAEARDETSKRVRDLRDRLVDGLLDSIPGAFLTGDPDHRLPNICSLAIEEVEADALMVLLDQAGVCGSAGASCASGALEPSHVLRAMGVPAERAGGSIRLSLGWPSTADDVDLALDVVPAAVAQLRGAKP